MFLAQPVVTGIALHTLVALDGGALNDGVDVNRFHRANIRAVAARNAFIWVDPHKTWNHHSANVMAALRVRGNRPENPIG
jgi:hypothetical protein